MDKKVKNNNTRMIKIGTYTILILLIVTFIGAPIISNNAAQKNISDILFGKYGSEEIRYIEGNYFERSVQSVLQQYADQYPKQNQEQFMVRLAWNNAFNQTVLYYALLDAAKHTKFEPTQEAVKEVIIDYEVFKTDGSFDREKYNSLTDTIKQNVIEDQTKQSTIEKVYNDILAPTYISSQELAFYVNLDKEQHAFSFVRFSKSEIKDKTLLQEYGKSHSDLFQKIEFKSITVATKEEADTVHKKIMNEETNFEDAVTSFSIDSSKDSNGERGSHYAYQIENNDGETTLETLRTLSIGDISNPIETSIGNYAIYTLSNEITNPDFSILPEEKTVENNSSEPSEDISPLEETYTMVEEYLNAYEPGIIEDEVFVRANSFIDAAKNTNFDAVAKEKELELGNIPLAPLNVDNISLLSRMTAEEEGADLGGLPSEQDVLSKIFALNTIDEISTPFVIGGYIYVFQVTEIKNATNDTATEISEENRTRVIDFLQSTNQNLIRNAVINKKKFIDNFDTSFSTLYPQ